MSLPAYAEYKDSGVEWLGDVPKHWEAVKIKWRLTTVSGGTPSTSNYNRYYEGEIPWIRTTDLNNSELYEAEIFVTDYAIKETSCREVKKDSVLIAMYGGDGTIGKHSLLMFDAAINQAVCAFLPNKFVESVYLHFYVEFYRTHWMYGAESSRKDANIGQDRIGDHYVTIPSKDEQSTIVGFLEHETAKIDALIAEQQRLIELLKEKRQAVISHAVTKGLDPNAPMKDSGVEWLGDVPEHWVVVTAKRISKVFVPQRNKPQLNTLGDGVYWVTMEDMKSSIIEKTNFCVSEDDIILASSKVLSKGSVISSCVGVFGVASINTTDVIINQQLQAFIPSDSVDPIFLLHCTRCAKGYFEQIATAATLLYVNQQGFENMPLAIPLVNEQKAIADFLDQQTAKIDELISHAHQGIDLLKERRSALISAAVTGKIDVRGWQPPATAVTIPQGQQQILLDD